MNKSEYVEMSSLMNEWSSKRVSINTKWIIA